MEKTKAGCPVEAYMFGLVCKDCGATDYLGRDLCASKAERDDRKKADAAPEQVMEVPEDAPRVIGLCGLAGSGKSTAAEFLSGLGYTRLRFADGLKRMLRHLLYTAGVEPEEAFRCTDGDLKEQPHPALGGRSPRYAMQTLGTEWGRKLFGEDFWVQIAMRQAQKYLNAGGRVVFEDVRFANEAAAVRWMCGGGQVWQVKGRAAKIAQDGAFHESERLEVAPDLVLDNSGDLEALEAQVLEHILG